MIELIMFFCLGFLVAGLLALLFLPFIHARALRLAARRLSMEIPAPWQRYGPIRICSGLSSPYRRVGSR
jgi:hypothetical protein